MPTKYEILASLIDSEAREIGDASGYHHALVGVLRDLHDWEAGKSPEKDLAAAIYNRLASVVDVDSFDDAEPKLAPGEIDPVTGRYNPEEG
ncbi:hypothetical protein KIV56_04515 [Cryobacterium breve]|uniref:Uncharacterized protein n=1 Tax=Cryobacterium breve TaxID=1259258 RepID=A0ABY7NDX1_9MICO|nr:hypothetical protein [Cryobacterium breve]WBM80666.1 hypothetical protein KIV56_04515 [Cryobacterium breve]